MAGGAIVKSLLVVEDDRSLAEMIREILEDSLYAVTLVGGLDAIPAESRPSLVITDLMTRSGYNSASAIRQVRDLRQRTGSPVLVLTAHGEARADGGLLREATAVLTKPFDVNELLEAVTRLSA